MKPDHKTPYFNSISELHQALGLPKPLDPLLSLVDYNDITADTETIAKGMILNFYKVSYKKNFKGSLTYGQGHYDFDEGGLSFMAPNQIIRATGDGDYGGYTLLFHPDFLRNHTLGKTIKGYGFFSYAADEALYLSDTEKTTVMGIFKTIDQELMRSIDHFSQDIIISQIEQLLQYSNRFYNRQFITRKIPNNMLLYKIDNILSEYFDSEKIVLSGLPTVQFLSEELDVSSRYLSDMLRIHTGQNTQQHIQKKLTEKAKELLSTTDLSVAQVAYQLGFEHPQSFNRTFKRETSLSPIAFRMSFKY